MREVFDPKDSLPDPAPAVELTPKKAVPGTKSCDPVTPSPGPAECEAGLEHVGSPAPKQSPTTNTRKQNYDLLESLSPDLTQRDDSQLEIGKWKRQNTLREILSFMKDDKNLRDGLKGIDRMGVGRAPFLKEGTLVIFPGLHHRHKIMSRVLVLRAKLVG